MSKKKSPLGASPPNWPNLSAPKNISSMTEAFRGRKMLPLIVLPSVPWNDTKAPQPLVTRKKMFTEVVEQKPNLFRAKRERERER